MDSLRSRYSLTGPPPTAALVTHFSVRSVPGGNLVRWETATEARVTGFNVQRAVEPTGPWTQVNHAILPATGGAATGGRYELLDAGAMAGTWHYRLEVVDAGAPSTFAGPVAVAGEAGTVFLPWAGRGDRPQ